MISIVAKTLLFPHFKLNRKHKMFLKKNLGTNKKISISAITNKYELFFNLKITFPPKNTNKRQTATTTKFNL